MKCKKKIKINNKEWIIIRCFGHFGITDNCFNCVLKDDCKGFLETFGKEYELRSVR